MVDRPLHLWRQPVLMPPTPVTSRPPMDNIIFSSQKDRVLGQPILFGAKSGKEALPTIAEEGEKETQRDHLGKAEVKQIKRTFSTPGSAACPSNKMCRSKTWPPSTAETEDVESDGNLSVGRVA